MPCVEERRKGGVSGVAGLDARAQERGLQAEALQDLLDTELRALRRTAERECAAPLLALPVLGGDEGRGLHSSTFQLNLSRSDTTCTLDTP
jgi:hypothetical protein